MGFAKNNCWHEINLLIWMPQIISVQAALDYRQIRYGRWEN